ncbi:MAG: hydrogenase expression protein HypE [Acidimicrobiales bacterium]
MSETAGDEEVPVLWITAGLGCDGDSIALTAATQPSLEDLVLGALPGVPRVRLHHPVLAYETGAEFLSTFEAAAGEDFPPFVLVVEGSIPGPASGGGSWAALGIDDEGQPIPTTVWIDRLAARAWAVVAIGTCAAYGGIHAMAGNPTGAMGLADYLGWSWRSRGGLPIVNVPGCPVQPDNCTETLLYLLRQYVGAAPPIPLDEVLRPQWLFYQTVHEGCDRAGYYEQGDFAAEYGSPRCIVKLGCWGPVSDCNVGKRGWINGVGGCANVGGACIGCTMPGFPDKFLPFLDEPPGAKMSSSAVLLYGRTVRALRKVTRASLNVEPEWRAPRPPESDDGDGGGGEE